MSDDVDWTNQHVINELRGIREEIRELRKDVALDIKDLAKDFGIVQKEVTELKVKASMFGAMSGALVILVEYTIRTIMK